MSWCVCVWKRVAAHESQDIEELSGVKVEQSVHVGIPLLVIVVVGIGRCQQHRVHLDRGEGERVRELGGRERVREREIGKREAGKKDVVSSQKLSPAVAPLGEYFPKDSPIHLHSIFTTDTKTPVNHIAVYIHT